MAVPHIEKALVPFFKKYPLAKLDGEMFNWELREQLNKIMELVRRTVHITEQHLIDSERLVRFYVYDGFGFGANQIDGYLQRKKMIDERAIGIPYIEKVETIIVHSKAELDTVYQSFLSDKQEGAIIRILDAPYEEKRSKYLLKYKPVDDGEGKIIAILEGEGNWTGMAAKATLQWKDKTFDATFKGTEDQKTVIWQERKQWIGKEVTFWHNGRTGYGIPNYARIDVNNCFKK
jgi:DNA ligase-1